MEYIEANLRDIRARIDQAAAGCGRNPDEIRLMAVTKTVPPEKVNHSIACGVDLLGENKAQELCAKYELYHRGQVEIHFIGHLQTNKVRQIADKVSMIHSVDRERLAAEIDKESAKLDKVMDVLIEVNIGGEASKSGILPNQVAEFAASLGRYNNIRLRGLMAIPPICDDLCQNEHYFYGMQQLLVDIQAKKLDNSNIDILSMGMSGDFEMAIRYGANIIRLGTVLYGQRDYNV